MKAKLFIRLDQRHSDTQQVDKQLDAFEVLMDPTSTVTASGLNQTNPFSALGIPFDLNSPMQLSEAIEKDTKRINRSATFLNILRHFLLIPANSSVA